MRLSVLKMTKIFVGIITVGLIIACFHQAEKRKRSGPLSSVEIGLSDRHVLRILGAPDVVVPPDETYPYMQYLYRQLDESDGHVRVIFDIDLRVVQVIVETAKE